MKNSIKPQGCTNLKLRQLSRMVTRHYDQFFAEIGLKITQYSLLSHVVKQGPLRPGDLAKRMQMDASTLTRNLQPLAAMGLVTIVAGADARSRLVAATELGASKQTQAQQAWKAAQLALNKQLGAERVMALHALLDSCIEGMGSDEVGIDSKTD